MKKKILWSLVMVISLLLVGGTGTGYAAVSGPCVDCHTMHNSQGGAIMATDTIYGEAGYGSLTRGTCTGCHTGSATLEGGYPRVKLTSGSSDTNQLAGGYFTDGPDPGDNDHGDNSHTIDSVIAPAGYDDTTNYVGSDWYTGETDGLQCAGAAGCHGNETDTDPAKAITGGHHANDLKESNVGYRMLQIGTTAVVGSGAWDYEQALNTAPSSDDAYNWYSATAGAGAATGGSISRLCGKCHGNFHGNEDSGNTGVYNSAWVRHPTDEPLESDWEIMSDSATFYTADDWKYNPVGTVGAVDPLTASETLYVTCLSCHRAHGSAYDDILRFNYDDQCADGSTTTGCLGCHDRQR